jgi:transcriptional regulator of acetoin/glycerol metabolism
VESALERAQGVVSRAAAELGLSRQALYRRMDRLGIAIERRVR